MIRKTLAILLILIAITFGLNEFNQHIQHIHNLDKAVNYLLIQTNTDSRQNEAIIDIIRQSLGKLAQENKFLIQKLCKNIIENDNSQSAVAEAYNCLAKIDLLDKNIYSAIKHISYALEIFYTPQYASDLSTLITNEATEIYRQSLINLFGRASSLETPHYNLELATKLHRQAFDQAERKQRKSIDVALALNEKYLDFANTTIASILLNADLDSDYHFYIITDPQDTITERSRSELQNLQYIQPYKLEFREFPSHIIPTSNLLKNFQPQLLLYKVMLENLFPELQRLIVLDVDIIVQRDLYDLQNLDDFDNFILAAALDRQNLTQKECCHSYDYINAGVVVQNLAMMRKTNNTSRILNHINDNGKCMQHFEQDVLNSLYHDSIKHIAKKWNILTTSDESSLMPFILHYAGAKPFAPRYKTSPPEHIKLYQAYWKLVNTAHS